MDEISVTTIRLDFKEVEDVGNKNLENVVMAYPGRIKCSGDSDCESRKGVARSNFRGCIDVYSDWSAAMRATCRSGWTIGPPINDWAASRAKVLSTCMVTVVAGCPPSRARHQRDA